MRIAVGLDLNLDGYGWLLERAIALVSRAEGSLDLVFVGSGADKEALLTSLLDTVPADVRGQARLVPGDPADALIALTEGYDALVVGPREPSGIERFYQNAMAVRVLRRTRCPVFVPRTTRMGTARPRLLVGIDLESDRMDYVVNEARRWARALDGVVDLVHALPGSMPAVRRPEFKEAIEREWVESHAQVQAQAEALLELVDPPLRGTATIAPGEPEDILVKMSRDHDLLVVGNRDRKGIERLLLGGVARVVVVRASCDVLVLPTAAQGAPLPPSDRDG